MTQTETSISRYQLNHPKAYIGYALALAEGENRDRADELVVEYVTNGAGMARRGAENLGYIEERDGEYALTERGVWLSSHTPDLFGADTSAEVLKIFDDLRGARRRFVDEFPGLQDEVGMLAYGDETIETFVDSLYGIHHARIYLGKSYGMTTFELLRELWEGRPEFAMDLLVADDKKVRDILLGGTLNRDAWRSMKPSELAATTVQYHDDNDPDFGPIYRSSTTFQFKTMLWHLGLLQSKGKQSKDLALDDLEWSLEPDIVDRYSAPSVSHTSVQEEI